MQEIKFISLSETAVLLSFGHTINHADHEKMMQVKKNIEASPFKGFIESVPAYNSLAVYYNPLTVEKKNETIAASVIEQVKIILQREQPSVNESTSTTIISIPVCYDEEYGVDLKELSAQLKLSPEEIIQLHTGQSYKVFMIGFTPGFPYMGTVDEKLFTKRKAQPRVQVPKGSVAIAGNQTGIYPLATPGGWNIIGRSALNVFDQQKENPFVLKAGDQVQFTSITKKEFETLSAVGNPDSGFKH